ncbi:PRAME family member 9/15-like [Mesocricetus auratus]|uniref:PRAME family member 9/15-like n=1 Tax=Mesocricetus auratus TaxID=10036 RepID=A0ABM2XKX0_MESAU|nr:PRAME family member 9/15-like [Mesocricetus auratus]XP_040603378.1 PRAME family member 9/15-like [Mesocricetus auratus]
MNTRTPPTLEDLARQAMLRNEALTISVLEGLPKMLFLPLFQKAFNWRLIKIVRSMVAAWPLPYIPVGAFLSSSTLEFSQVVVEGLRDLLRQEDRPVRGNLQILDFRRLPHDFWTLNARAEDGDSSAVTVSENQEVKPPPRYEQRQRVKVITDLYSRFQQREEETDSLQEAQPRKDSLQLCCVNMKILLLSEDRVIMFRKIIRLWDVDVLELTIDWSWSSLLQFYPYFAHMINLHTLSLVWIEKNTSDHAYTSEYKWFVRTFISELSRISRLQHLYMNGICFLSDNMKHLLRNLKNRLETFSVTHCQLFRTNLYHLSQCRRLYQLKHLDMSGVLLSNFCMMPLRVLLEKVVDTLESLELEGCGIKDSQLRVLLPALSQCSKLSKVNFYTNDFSMNVLSDLLQHTANLSKMTMEQYPAPRECSELGVVSIEKFVQLCLVLMDTLRAVRQPKSVSFATDVCSRCSKRCVYEQETRLCSCLQ